MAIETRDPVTVAQRASAPAPSIEPARASAAPDDPRWSRRSVLKGIGVGAATLVVAGIGAGSYRVFDNGVLSAGSGRPYDAWRNWRDDPGPLGMVGAAILAANPHNSQPWIFHVGMGSPSTGKASRRSPSRWPSCCPPRHEPRATRSGSTRPAACTPGPRPRTACSPSPIPTTPRRDSRVAGSSSASTSPPPPTDSALVIGLTSARHGGRPSIRRAGRHGALVGPLPADPR
jgi:hypothetical protein